MAVVVILVGAGGAGAQPRSGGGVLEEDARRFLGERAEGLVVGLETVSAVAPAAALPMDEETSGGGCRVGAGVATSTAALVLGLLGLLGLLGVRAGARRRGSCAPGPRPQGGR